MASKPKDPAEPAATSAPAARYRVVSGGISTSTGAVWNGEIVTAEQLGDAARVRQLLDRGSIEVVDGANG